MRFWFSVPFLSRTRIGISVSDREIARALTPKRLTAEERSAREHKEAELDAWAKTKADKWAPLVTIAMLVIILWTIWRAILWIFF